MIDWGAPLEAVELDGRIVPVKLISQVDTNEYHVGIDGMDVLVGRSGKLRDGAQIRNVRQPTVSDEATRRMTALIERIANGKVDQSQTPLSVAINTEVLNEARAIAALLKPVDPRLALVVSALVQNDIGKCHAMLYARDVLSALDAASC